MNRGACEVRHFPGFTQEGTHPVVFAPDQSTREPTQAIRLYSCTVRKRETVGWARALFGGNGIVFDYNDARFFADSEALYAYEGTREMNSLIVGKAISGFSAFV